MTFDVRTTWPLLACLASFIVTFLVTRLITRMIRAGRGPFRNNVTSSGVHIHHAVPGLILLLIGAVMALAADWPVARILAGVAVGVGASLVLDEFALILHLQDVYWAKQGQASVQAVALATMCLSLVALGVSPVTDSDFTGGWQVVVPVAVMYAITLVCLVIAAMRGKYRLLLLAVFFPPVAWVAASRLAKPNSAWARRHYPEGSKKLAKAQRRESRLSRVWGKRWTEFADAVAGAPDSPPGVASDAPPALASDSASSRGVPPDVRSDVPPDVRSDVPPDVPSDGSSASGQDAQAAARAAAGSDPAQR
nr:hypothetical protein [Nakamurella aerolata]